MSENLWGDEPFNDMPDEAQLDEHGRPKEAPPAVVQRQLRPTVQKSIAPKVEEPEQFEVEELVEELLEEEEDFSDVYADANLRLEQGSLWKLIMNHELFDGVDADPKAMQNVQRAIRRFAKEQMEIMLGMRRETAQVEHLNIDFPFNSLEVEVLKKLAFTATKGATENSDNYVPTVTKVMEEVSVVPKRQTLNAIGSTRKVQPKPLQSKPLQKQSKAPIKRTRWDLTVDQIAREEGVPRELLEENVPGMDKSFHEMTDAEKEERNRLISKRRGVQVRSPDALPMPSYEQQESLASSLASRASTSHLSKLIEAAKVMPPSKKV